MRPFASCSLTMHNSSGRRQSRRNEWLGTGMRLELLDADESRALGAIVVSQDAGEISVEAGPADGLPVLRIRLSRNQALLLSSNLRAVANGRDEEVLLAEE